MLLVDRFSYRVHIALLFLLFTAVQNERQPRNSATLRPEILAEMDHERIIREAAAAVGAFG